MKKRLYEFSLELYMGATPYTTVVVEASPLISCLKINRFDLLEVFDCPIICLNHVKAELTYFGQEAKLAGLIAAKRVVEANLDTPSLLQEFANLHGNRPALGLGECASIVFAQNEAVPLIITDKSATNEARRRKIQCFTTEDVVVLNIQNGRLTIAQADDLLVQWKAVREGVSHVTSFATLLT